MYEPGETVSVLVARRDELLRFPLKIGPPPIDEWRLRVRSDATEAQQQRMRTWLELNPKP
jgi:hypothetical protein